MSGNNEVGWPAAFGTVYAIIVGPLIAAKMCGDISWPWLAVFAIAVSPMALLALLCLVAFMTDEMVRK